MESITLEAERVLFNLNGHAFPIQLYHLLPDLNNNLLKMTTFIKRKYYRIIAYDVEFIIYICSLNSRFKF